MPPRANQLIAQMRTKGTARNRKVQERFGIRASEVLGVCAPELRKLARSVGSDHALALELRRSGVFEARILAALVEDPTKLTPKEMDTWALEFENWADCDAACYGLFDRTPHAAPKAVEWSRRKEEFVRRGGLAIMAGMAVHDKGAADSVFLAFLPHIERAASDERPLVKKGASWALRQIGKRNVRLNRAAVARARKIARVNSPSARWVASDALRELTHPKVRARIASKRA
jgi:3-methyladenine DNA glycosylase AlkD